MKERLDCLSPTHLVWRTANLKDLRVSIIIIIIDININVISNIKQIETVNGDNKQKQFFYFLFCFKKLKKD